MLLLFGFLIVTDATAERLPTALDKNAVQFIFQRISETNYIPVGTCFTVTVPVFKKGLKRIFGHIKGLNFPYVVTAKHVLFDTNGKVRPELYWRIGKIGGGVTYTPLTPSPTNVMRILTHPDTSVDIAVITIDLSQSLEVARALNQKEHVIELKEGRISSTIIRDKKTVEKQPIREGDDLFFVGLFTPFYGATENVPICRFGRVSLVTDEKIPFADAQGGITPQDLYLVESGVFGGNSGSPAFVYRSKAHRNFHIVHPDALQDEVFLAGVVKGTFRDWSEIKVVNTRAATVSSESVGVAAIVPGYYLHEILFSDTEKEFRARLAASVFETKK